MKKMNDMTEISNKITYHRYMFSKDQAEALFKDITIPEYIALEEIKGSIENGKVYLKDISEKMKVSISKASKLAAGLKEKGLVIEVKNLDYSSLKKENLDKIIDSTDREIIETKKIIKYTHLVESNKGVRKHLKISKFPFLDNKGKVSKIIVCYIDDTLEQNI